MSTKGSEVRIKLSFDGEAKKPPRKPGRTYSPEELSRIKRLVRAHLVKIDGLSFDKET